MTASSHESDEDGLYVMSSEQRNYYLTLFMHLQYVAHGEATLTGSVSGTDAEVVAFFLKSGLDKHDLGRIWDLADVNIDGRLNQNEFAVAMHLVVLKSKVVS